jgi:hypothetical protein
LHIIDIKPEPPGSGSTIARFNVALNDDLRLFGLRLTERAAGGHAVYAPNAHGARVATFSPTLVDQISRAALAALEERMPHDNRKA